MLLQPLYLIVEDETSDGAFVLWVARVLGRDAVWRAYMTGQLAFRHAGGKGQIVKSASALTYGVWKRDSRPILSMQLRTIALLDRDCRFPGHTPNAQIAADLEPYVAFVHMLECRYIESYVPWKYARRRLGEDGLGMEADAYFRMAEGHRRHFPVKGGFVDNSTPPKLQDHTTFLADDSRMLEERNFYRSVDPHDWGKFAAGFGERLVDVFREPAYRCEPNEVQILTQDQRSELSGFLTKLIQYL